MSDTIRLAEVTKPRRFALAPDAAAREAIAGRLGILGVKKLSFEGEIVPEGRDDWRLEARLGATVVQPCVVTLEPVTTRIDEDVARLYLTDMPEPEGDEVEMPEDDTAEAAPLAINVAEVMEEALALALPPWPRKEGVEPVEVSVSEPGIEPLSDDDVKPFAALKTLKDRMEDTGSDDD